MQDGKTARWKQIDCSALVYWEDGEMKVNVARWIPMPKSASSMKQTASCLDWMTELSL